MGNKKNKKSWRTKVDKDQKKKERTLKQQMLASANVALESAMTQLAAVEKEMESPKLPEVTSETSGSEEPQAPPYGLVEISFQIQESMGELERKFQTAESRNEPPKETDLDDVRLLDLLIDTMLLREPEFAPLSIEEDEANMKRFVQRTRRQSPPELDPNSELRTAVEALRLEADECLELCLLNMPDHGCNCRACGQNYQDLEPNATDALESLNELN